LPQLCKNASILTMLQPCSSAEQAGTFPWFRLFCLYFEHGGYVTGTLLSPREKKRNEFFQGAVG